MNEEDLNDVLCEFDAVIEDFTSPVEKRHFRYDEHLKTVKRRSSASVSDSGISDSESKSGLGDGLLTVYSPGLGSSIDTLDSRMEIRHCRNDMVLVCSLHLSLKAGGLNEFCLLCCKTQSKEVSLGVLESVLLPLLLLLCNTFVCSFLSCAIKKAAGETAANCCTCMHALIHNYA